MWFRSRHLLWAALFIWVAILRLRLGIALSLVIFPFLGLGFLFIAQEYLERKYRPFGRTLGICLAGLILIYNSALTVQRQFPDSWEALVRILKARDTTTAEWINPLDQRARDVLKKYLSERQDIELQKLQDQLGKLNEKRRNGTFTADDSQKEQELLKKLNHLIDEREELKKRLIESSPGNTPTLPPNQPQNAEQGNPQGIGTPTDLLNSQPRDVASNVPPVPEQQPPRNLAPLAEIKGQREFSGEIYKVGNGVEAPTIIYRVEPEYTLEAKQAEIEGTIVLSAIVRKDGTLEVLKIIRGLGYGLDQSAMVTLAKWRFKPGSRSGQPVDVALNIEVSFRLYY